MTDKKADANHKAWTIWQSARKTAARDEDVTEWQRLNKATNALDRYHPMFKPEDFVTQKRGQ